MKGMVDIHAHILPNVDDGPDSWEAALETVRLAAQDGITDIVSTSHMLPDGAYANRRSTLLALVDELRRRVAAEGIPINVHVGGEVYLTPEVGQAVKAGDLLTYCDAGRYILVELPAGEFPSYAEHALFDLQLAGVTPIIAHPERNRDIIDDPSRLLDLVERGILVQVTASSLRATPYMATAELLIRHRAVHFVASDTHGPDRRPPRLSSYIDILSQLAGEGAARQLLVENPRRVIEGADIEPEPVIPLRKAPARRPFFLRRLGGRR